jgi:hypothetical protein
MKNSINIFCILFLLLFYTSSYSQSIPRIDSMGEHLHWNLEDKINKSDAVVEGVIINETRWGDASFFGPQGKGVIFTSIIIRVSRVFKGEIKDTIIELVTDGGRSSDGLNTSSTWGMLYKGQEGVFFLRQNNTTIQSGKNIQSFLYLHSKSVMLYNHGQPYYPITHDGTKRYDDLEKELYPAIETITGRPAKVVGVRTFQADVVKKE